MALTAKQLERIALLRDKRLDRGCTQGEVDAAITLIGRMVYEAGLNGHRAPPTADTAHASLNQQKALYWECEYHRVDAKLATVAREADHWREKYEALAKERTQPQNPFTTQSTEWWRTWATDEDKTTGNGQVHVRGSTVWVEGCVCLRERDRAVLVKLPDGHEEWFPRSQWALGNEIEHPGDRGTLKITIWIARQKGVV